MFNFRSRAACRFNPLHYFAAQNHPGFVQAMVCRMVFGLMTAVGGGLLFGDLLVIGKSEQRPAAIIDAEWAPEPAN